MLAVLGVATIVGALVPGDVSTRGTVAERQPPPRREAADAPSHPGVDTAWVPKARQLLAAVDAQLAQIQGAERAAAAIPSVLHTGQIRNMLASLKRVKSWLEWWRGLLHADLAAVAAHQQTATDLASVRWELKWVNDARNSLRRLSVEADRDVDWMLTKLDAKASGLAQRQQSLQAAEQTQRGALETAGLRSLPALPTGLPGLISDILRALAGLKARADDRPIPPSSKPPTSAERPPGRDRRTSAPPRPGGSGTGESAPSPGPPTGDAPILPAPSGSSEPSEPSGSTGLSDSGGGSSSSDSDGGSDPTITDPSDPDYGTVASGSDYGYDSFGDPAGYSDPGYSDPGYDGGGYGAEVDPETGVTP